MLLGLVGALWCTAIVRGGESATLPSTEIMIRGHLFTLEIASTPPQHERGLMYRTVIPFDGGMLFNFSDDAIRSFWMCHTLVALDLIFLDREARITALHTMHPEPPPAPGESEDAYRRRLPLYSSRIPCRYAIEFKAGTLGLLHLKIGDRLALDTETLQSLTRPEGE